MGRQGSPRISPKGIQLQEFCVGCALATRRCPWASCFFPPPELHTMVLPPLNSIGSEFYLHRVTAHLPRSGGGEEYLARHCPCEVGWASLQFPGAPRVVVSRVAFGSIVA